MPPVWAGQISAGGWPERLRSGWERSHVGDAASMSICIMPGQHPFSTRAKDDLVSETREHAQRGYSPISLANSL